MIDEIVVEDFKINDEMKQKIGPPSSDLMKIILDYDLSPAETLVFLAASSSFIVNELTNGNITNNNIMTFIKLFILPFGYTSLEQFLKDYKDGAPILH